VSCAQCTSGTYSTAVGLSSSCFQWKIFYLIIDVEDDSKPLSNAKDRTCAAYQYSSPIAVKIFIFCFGQIPLCCLFCFLFVCFGPRCFFPNKDGNSHFVFHNVKSKNSKKTFAHSRLIAPVDRSLLVHIMI